MNKNIIIEALDFSVHKFEITMWINGKSDELLNNYGKFKAAYKSLRIYDKYEKDICISALNLFKAHLKVQSELDENSDIKNFILKKITNIENQINEITTTF